MKINNLEHFRARMASGAPALGVCITLTDPTASELAADAGFDFCWIDGEHGNLDRATLAGHVMALRGTACAPLIRVPCNAHVEIKKVIDLAPAGIIVPMVNTAAEAMEAVAACRYPPVGNRGCGFRRGLRYGAESLEAYWTQSQQEPLVLVQIEHVDAVRNIDAILTTPGLDGICLGPFDLSASVGKPGQFDDPAINRMIDDVCRKTRIAGLFLGAYGADIAAWRQRGVQWLALVNDTEAMFHHYRGLLHEAT